jgi:outer membrane protein TolC
MRFLPFFIGFCFISSFSLSADGLTLESYLSQVKQKHSGFQASSLTSQGALERSAEASLLVTPSLFSQLQYSDDQKPTVNPDFFGSRTVFQNYTLGVAEQTKFGLSAKLSYNITRTELFGVNDAFVPVPKFYTASPMLELSQALWKNGLGSEVRAQTKMIEAQAKAISLGETLKAKSVLAEAESAYWRLAIAHQLVAVAKDGVERAKKIREWSSRRASLALADKSDALQAEAGFEGKQLELQMALDEERDAAQQFNSMRGMESETATETLDAVGPDKLAELNAPARQGEREDVLAAEEGRKAAQAATELGRDKNSPTLDLVSSYSLNGRDTALGQSVSDASKTGQSTFTVGVKFSTSLDFGTLSSDRAGYLKEEKGAELNYQRKLFEDKVQWGSLVAKFAEAKRRLQMAQTMEKVQQDKLENERARLKTGRSVLYQVLQFEQDYANSQALTLKTELQLLALQAQMKTYLPLGDKL